MRRKRPKQLELLPAVRVPTGGAITTTDTKNRREVVQALAELLLAIAAGTTPVDKEVDDEPEDHR